MDEERHPPAIDRIDRALRRIEAATARRPLSDDYLTERHANLRASAARAIALLNDLLDQGRT